MELELGLKITKTRDDITSISEYQLVKDRIGPVFQSRETNTMFILTAHLKGYRRNNIDIKISEDGSKISISGEKPIQEMLMMGWIMLKKDVEITRFNRVFKIPDGVILDWIKAKYDEEEWILKIVMPKSVKGICGARIEEVKEEEHDRVRSDLEKSEADHILNNVGETSQKGSEESEVQQMKDGESVMKEEGLSEKMLEDANVDRVKDTIKTKTEESNLGIDGNGKGAREKVDKVEYEVMKTSDLEQNVGASIPQNTGDTSKDKESEIQEMEDSEGFMEKNDQRVSDKVLNDANGGIIGEKIQKEIKDGNGVSLREKGAKAAAVYGAMKTPEIEQKVGAGIPQNIGDASHDNEYEVQEMVDNGTYGSSVEEKEKMVSDKMLDNANGNMIGEMIKKEIEESKPGMEGGDGESVRENDRKAACEAMKKSELEQKVGAGIPQNIGDTSHSKESEVVEMEDNATYGSNVEEKEKMVSDKMLDNANGKIIGDTIKKQIEESKLRIEGGDGASVREKDKKAGCEAMKTLEPEQNVRAHIPQSIGDTSQEFSRESVVQQMQEAESAVEKVDRQETGKMLAKANGFSQEDTHGESKQKEFAESKSETEDIHKENVEEVISMERFEETKTSELDQNVADDQIPSKVGGIDQEESEECRIQYQEESKECAIQQTEKTESVEGNMNGSESERMPFEANNAIQVNIFQETIQKDNKTPEVETVHEHEECEREKAGKEGFEAITTVKEDFHKQLPKAPQEVSKGLNVSKMKESNEAKEAMAKRKGKEIESFVEKGEGKEPKVVHAEAKTLAQKDIQIGEKLPDGSKGLMDAKMEEPKEAIWEAMAEGEKLMENVEGETSKKRTEKAGRDIKKRTLSETLQKEDEEPDIERKAKDESYVPDIIVKGVFDVMGTIQVKVPKKVAEAMALDEKDKTEHSTVTLKGEGSIRMNFEANKVFEEDKTRDRTEKEIREPKLKSRDQLSMQENTDREAVDGSKRQEFPEVGETEDVKEEAVRIEQSVKEVNREKYEKIEVEVHEGFRKDITREAIQKEISDPKIQTKERDQCLQEKMGKGRFKASKAAKEEFPMEMVDSPATEKEQLKDTRIGEAKEELVKQKSEEKMGKTEDTEDDAKIEQSVKKVKGEKYEKIQVETNGDKRKDITRETTQKETREPEIQSKEKDQQCLQEEMSKGRLEVSKAAQEEFLVKTIDSLANKREGLKDRMPEKAKEVKEELGKQHSEEKKEEIEDVKDKGVAIEQLVKKDITRKTTQKETKQPKIQTEEKDQQCLQDATSKGRLEASTTAREFPLQMIDSLSKRRVESKDKKIEETEKVKQEVSKRKTKETKVVESTTEEKIQESDSKRITKILQEVQKEKHPKALEIGTNERELQPKTSLTTDAKVVSMGFKEVEQVSAKKQKTELLSPIVRSKDTLESRKESVDQGTIKSKKAKEAEKGAQYTYNIESTKAVATIEDQVAKPRFQSTQQFEAEEGKLQEGCKEKYEPSPKSQKEYHTKDLQHSVEMKDQESKHMEMLKPEVPSEELRKKSEQDTRKDEFQKGEKIEKTMQEDIEQPKDKIDDRDQQYVQQDVGKEVGAVEIIRREMPKEEYVSNAGPTAGRMETKTDLEATLERQKYITQNVNDEKLGIKEEIKRNNFEKMDKVKFTAELMKTTQVKEHQRKSEAVEKEAEPLEAKSSLPSLTSIGVKDMGPELHHKDLSPLTLTEETKSKEPLKLEQPNMECKLPKTKEHVPESRDRKRYGYGIEDIEAPKITAYKGAKPSKLQSSTLTQQSIDEENRTPENVVDELPKENTDTDFQKSIESVTPTENEYNETFQARILENQGLEDNQEVCGQEAAPSECGYQERNQEGIKCPRISTGDRGRQYVQKDHDKKGYQTTKAVDEELLKRQYRAEKIVLEEREVPKVAKSGETKEASKQLHIREKGKTTQTAEDKKPKMKEITPEFEKVNEFKQIEEGMREPPTKIEKIPKKGMEESQREEMSPLPTEIQRKEPHELSWPSIATQRSQVKEEDITDESHKVEKQESKKEDSNATVQDSNRSKADQEVEQIETQQPECHKDQIFINKDEEQSQLIHDTEEGKNNELQVEEEGEVVEVEQQKEYEEEEASGQNKNKTKRTKKLFVPLFVAGSALLVSLVFIFAHRIRARKRSS